MLLVGASAISATLFGAGLPGGYAGIGILTAAFVVYGGLLVVSLAWATWRSIRRGWKSGVRYMLEAFGVVVAAVAFVYFFTNLRLPSFFETWSGLVLVLSVPVVAWLIHLARVIANDRREWKFVR